MKVGADGLRVAEKRENRVGGADAVLDGVMNSVTEPKAARVLPAEQPDVPWGMGTVRQRTEEDFIRRGIKVFKRWETCVEADVDCLVKALFTRAPPFFVLRGQ
ncbi:hypothetical protein N4G69_25485 [Streptomyces mirabilis]|nr:hypothetical protein [Streptomyces mirabilis]MCT9108925.1 hypothetical protein [Streptomyces mirabilis]